MRASFIRDEKIEPLAINEYIIDGIPIQQLVTDGIENKKIAMQIDSAYSLNKNIRTELAPIVTNENTG